MIIRWPIRNEISNAQRSIVVAPPMLQGPVWEHRQWIGDRSPNHRRYHHIEYTSPIFTRACWEGCVADVSLMYLGHFEPWCTSPNVRRLLGAARRYIANGSFNACMSRCLCEAWRLLAYVAALAYVALPTRCSNLCIARASGGLKILVGP